MIASCICLSLECEIYDFAFFGSFKAVLYLCWLVIFVVKLWLKTQCLLLWLLRIRGAFLISFGPEWWLLLICCGSLVEGRLHLLPWVVSFLLLRDDLWFLLGQCLWLGGWHSLFCILYYDVLNACFRYLFRFLIQRFLTKWLLSIWWCFDVHTIWGIGYILIFFLCIHLDCKFFLLNIIICTITDSSFRLFSFALIIDIFLIS